MAHVSICVGRLSCLQSLRYSIVNYGEMKCKKTEEGMYGSYNFKTYSEFELQPYQVQNTIKLIDEGYTIPFIARYRKEVTGELNDQVLRELHERLIYLRNLESRKEDVKRIIEEAGKLTKDISDALLKAETLQEVEDIYLPYRPKRRTRASIAREKGLSLAAIIFLQVRLEKSFRGYSQTLY